jgi:hypothetical protein
LEREQLLLLLLRQQQSDQKDEFFDLFRLTSKQIEMGLFTYAIFSAILTYLVFQWHGQKTIREMKSQMEIISLLIQHVGLLGNQTMANMQLIEQLKERGVGLPGPPGPPGPPGRCMCK